MIEKHSAPISHYLLLIKKICFREIKLPRACVPFVEENVTRIVEILKRKLFIRIMKNKHREKEHSTFGMVINGLHDNKKITLTVL